jgi:hypothetical protein
LRRAIVRPASTRRRRKLKDAVTAPATQQCPPSDSRNECNDLPAAPLTWAERFQRIFAIDITTCPLCGGQLRVNRRLIAKQSAMQFATRIADTNDPDLIRQILDHVDSRAPPTPAASARQLTPHPARPIRRTLKTAR